MISGFYWPSGLIGDMAGVPTRRAATLPAAALVLDRVLKRLRPGRIVFSMLGVREGWMYEQISRPEHTLDPLVEGAQAFGLPFARVSAFAAALVHWTATLFSGETAPERLEIGNGHVRLHVRRTARVPESEVVTDRLRLLADAVGARRIDVLETE